MELKRLAIILALCAAFFVPTWLHGSFISIPGAGGGVVTAINTPAENRLVTLGAILTELDGEANLTFDGTQLGVTGTLDVSSTATFGNIAVDNGDIAFTTAGTTRRIQGQHSIIWRVDADNNSVAAAHLFEHNFGVEVGRMIEGLFLWGHTVQTGASGGDIVLSAALANGGYRFLNGAGTSSANYGVLGNNLDNLRFNVPATSDAFDFDWAGSNFFNILNTGTGPYLLFRAESGDPGATTVNRTALFTQDDGGGNTQLGARFSSGAAIILATAGVAPPNVSNTGTPLDNELAVWTSATVIEGDANFTWTGTVFTPTGQTGHPVQTVALASTTFAVTRDSVDLNCAAPQNLNTITGGVVGQRLLIFHDDGNCTIIDDNAPTAANAINMKGGGGGGDNSGSVDESIVLIFNGTHWIHAGGETTT